MAEFFTLSGKIATTASIMCKSLVTLPPTLSMTATLSADLKEGSKVTIFWLAEARAAPKSSNDIAKPNIFALVI
ncbi:MAG: hypothetical protein WCP55_18360 [Lentisphaerota bacterium]